MSDETEQRRLRKSTAHADPFDQFAEWFEEAQRAVPILPEGMTLATVAEDGQPQARVVLLKGFDERGFVFFTNYHSAKARQLAHSPKAALNFWWGALERQVRISGSVEKVSSDESDVYFATRPRGSQIGAWASDQSAPVERREILEERVAELINRYENRDVPRPPHWGGYRLRPDRIEFWQGRADRLHDRLVYERRGDSWSMTRLNP